MMSLLEGCMFPLSLLEWMLNPLNETIDEAQSKIMPLLLQIGKTNAGYGFLLVVFLK